MTHTARNPYCDRWILPIPRIEDFVHRRAMKPFYFLILALLENGAPLDLDAIVARLLEAGVPESFANPRTLQKAWHGLAPVYRDKDGKFGLDLNSSEMDWIILVLELRPRPEVAAAEPLPEIVMPGDDVPLSRAEVVAAVKDRGLSSVSMLRRAAAALDALGEPMSIDALAAELTSLTESRLSLTPRDVAYWRGDLILQLPGSILAINRESEALRPMREAIRKLAHPVLIQQAWQALRTAQWREKESVWEEERRQASARARMLRRGLLRVVPKADHPAAAMVLSVKDRQFRFFRPDEHEELRHHLREFDVLIGLHVRETLQALGVEPDNWQMLDLRPSQKTMKLNQRGRTLSITTELVITSTTGISRPLGDPARVAGYLAGGDWRKLSRRLESDAKAMFAHYRYGLLHHYVRLRWGFLDEFLSADWALPDDVHLRDLLEEAKASEVPVDLVCGSAPGWEHPWARAVRARVIEISTHSVAIQSAAGLEETSLFEIQAIRLAPEMPREGP